MLNRSQLRDRELATRWLAAGHTLVRLPDGLGERTGMPQWIADLLAEQGTLPPVGVISDLAQLFAGHSLKKAGHLPSVNPRLRSVLRSYEDHVLGRMGACPVFEQLCDCYCSLTPRLQSRAVTILTQRFLSRIEFSQGASLSLGLVREVIRAPRSETRLAGLEALSEDGPVAEAITQALEEIVQKSRRCATLLDSADLFLVENVHVLGELTQRLFIEQLVEVETTLSASLPKRLKARRKPLRAKISTALSAEEQYPAGGFSSISNSGSLENLVISELIYMDDPEEGGQGVDLFDLRYAEGELLYYTRDDAFFSRDQRVIQIVFDRSLGQARIKDEGEPWQRLVTGLGLAACAVERLSEWLGAEHGLQFRLAFIGDSLESEMGVLKLLLRDWIELGVVEVCRVSSMDEVLPELEEFAQSSEVDFISFSYDSLDLDGLPSSYQVAQIQLDEATPKLRWRHEAEDTARLTGGGEFSHWQRLALRLFSSMV